MTWWQYVQQQMAISRDTHKYCHMCRKLVREGETFNPVESSWNPQEEAYATYVCPECDENYAINDLPWEE